MGAQRDHRYSKHDSGKTFEAKSETGDAQKNYGSARNHGDRKNRSHREHVTRSLRRGVRCWP
jgi:hypothetical protein